MDRSRARDRDEARENDGAEREADGDDAADLAVPPTRRSGVYETLRPPPPGLPEPAPPPEPPVPAPFEEKDARATMERVYRTYFDLVAERLQRPDGAPDSWERVHQEVFLVVYKHILEKHEVPTEMDRFLATVATHQIGNYRTARARARCREYASVDDVELPASQPTPEDQAGADERRRILEDALDGMPSLDADVIRAADFDEEPQEEAAARLGLTFLAFRSRLMRARARLTENVQRHLGLPRGGRR